jgi:hypothetical protein
MTLFGIIREMLARGELGTVRTFHPQMGEGERLTYLGEPVTILTGTHQAAGVVFRDPHDVMLTASGQLITAAYSVA